MNPGRLLILLGCLALACTISYAGPTVKIEADGARDFAIFGPFQWVDMLVRIDPGEDAIAAKGLEVSPAAGPGVQFGEAIYPAPDKGETFTKPFVLRVPVQLPDAQAHEVSAAVAGKRADGKKLELSASGTLRASADTRGHVQATAALKRPAKAGEKNAVVVTGTIIDGYHVYGKKVDVGIPLVARLLPAPGTRGAPAWVGGGPTSPPDKEYYGQFSVEIPFTPAKSGTVKLRVGLVWQACTELICDPNEIAYLNYSFPVAQGVPVPVPNGSNAADGTTDVGGAPDAAAGATDASDAVDGDEDLDKMSLLELILLAIGGGLFALAMPCTYPLIPITISFFTKQAEQRHGGVVPLALAYGTGIVVIFTIVGVVFGAPILEFATLWWVNALFALLFLVFGLSLIGLFEIRLPGFFNDIAAKASGTGGYFSVFAMGTTLVITSFTCTAPIIGLVLVWAAEGGSLFKVGLAMAVFGLTMAIPFVFLALSPKALQAMPRSGEWMKTLKVTLGIVELGLVLKFVSNMDLAFGTFLIGRELFLALWGLSFLAAGLYLLRPLDLLRRGAAWSMTSGRGTCAAAFLAITAYLATGVDGTRLGKNLEAFLPVLPDVKQEYTEGFLAVVKEDFEAGVAKAKELDALIFLDFTGFQ